MKKLIIILTFTVISITSFSQKIQNAKTKEITELKEKVLSYCSVVMQPYQGKIDFFIGIDELGVWKLLDENNKQIEFQTIISLMNYLDKNRWEYINNIGGSDSAAPQYFFKKKK